MKILKNNKKLIIGFIIGAILTGGIVYAATSAGDIQYTRAGRTDIKNVADALNDIYNTKIASPKVVTTMTTKGASYTFQHDGYITGTITNEGAGYAVVFFNDSEEIAISESNHGPRTISVYVPSGTKVSTREEYGTYDLTLYEIK